MTDDLDRLDRELREYGERWRATIPAASVRDFPAYDSDPDRRSRLLILAAVAAVIVVLLGVSLLSDRSADDGQPATDQAVVPTTSATPGGIVPWSPLDPAHPDIPQVTIPATPDPKAAAAAPPCTTDDLRAVSAVGAAAGTTVLSLTIRPASPDVSCRLQGHPAVEFLDHGQPVDIPTVNAPDDSVYRDPALVTEGSVVTLSLFWASNWCAEPVDNDRIRIALEQGWLEVDGYGRSPGCNSTPGSGPNSVRIDTFEPESFQPVEVTSAYGGIDGELTTIGDPVPGEELRFLVILTARRGDVRLDPCPDYTMVQYPARDGSVTARFALNCAAVPYRDAEGVPYLPDDVPVRFEMRLTLLGPDAQAYKAGWTLEAPGGPAMTIPTRSGGNR
jgi:hypothetical protein